MNDTQVNDPIKVWCFFDEASSSAQHLFPIAMNWRRRFVKFSKLVFASSKKVGDIRIVNLVCSSDTANYELEFDTSSYLWKLKKVMALE